ncbi:MAG TPA: hypothetical protein VHW60_10300 [Caulobacteraceae bacterium]|jgi:hypothetical protein|nr:hypothetical protein [Caulobacteraceae bacterium]
MGVACFSGSEALATQPAVFASGGAPSADDVRAAQAQLLHDTSLQFAFSKAPPPPPQPAPTQLPDWLAAIFRGIGGFLNFLAPVLGWIFIAGLAAAVLVVLYFVFREGIRTRWPNLFKRKPAPARPKPADWRPEAAAARALLEEADKLAASGSYAEAVRLILHRSIEDIEGRRPRLVRPAYTSREIGRLDDLPATARTTFMHIAEVVERSFFGGRDVDATGFAECRRTYEAFAFPGAWA